MFYEWFIGSRYLKIKSKRGFIPIITFISIGGVCIGVLSLIIILSVMNGFENELREKILGTNSHIVIVNTENREIKNYQNLLKEVENEKDVVAASPFLYAQVLLRSKNNVEGVIIRGIDLEAEERVTNLSKKIKYGSLNFNSGELPCVIIGIELAKKLEITLDGKIIIIAPVFVPSAVGNVPRMQEFRVVGIFETGMYQYDTSMVYTSLKDMQELFDKEDVISGIEVKVNDIFKAKFIALSLMKKLGNQYWVKHWIEMNKNLFIALRTEKITMFIILTLIILVAAFGIISTLIMTVVEKTKEIGILKSMGSSNMSIMRIFIFQGLIIGIVGTILGIILGLVGCKLIDMLQIGIPGGGEVYWLNKLPVKIELMQILLIICCSIIICFCSTFYPALKAAKLNPVEALKYE